MGEKMRPRAKNNRARRTRLLSPQRGDTSSVPKAQTLFRIHRKYRFYSDAVTVAPRAYFFLSCQKKVCKKEALDAKIALTREKQIVRFYVLSLHFRSRNALRATVESGFRIARQIMRDAMLAPVEYLTYEIRDVSDLV